MMLHYDRIWSKLILLESWIWCMILLTRISIASSSVFMPLSRKKEQLRGCDYEQAFEFYDFYTKPANNGVTVNWLCRRSSEDRLRICLNILKNLMGTKSEVVGRLNEGKRIDGRCHKQKITYRSDDDVPVKLTLKMFKCPVTQFDWPLHDRDDLPLRDFYIVQGTKKNTVFIFNSAAQNHLKVCATVEYNHKLNKPTSVIMDKSRSVYRERMTHAGILSPRHRREDESSMLTNHSFYLLILYISILSNVYGLPKREHFVGCDYEQAYHFYDSHSTRNALLKRNWICRRGFQENLQLCVDIFLRITRTNSIYTTLTLKNSATSVEQKCAKNEITYRNQWGSQKRIVVKMFRCPITQLEWRSRGGNQLGALFDFYITRGSKKRRIFIFNWLEGSKICANLEYDDELKTDSTIAVLSGRHVPEN